MSGGGDGTLKAFRTAAGLSQIDVAGRLGIGQGAVSQRERVSVLDLSLATMLEHIRATDPGTVVMLTASGLMLRSASIEMRTPTARAAETVLAGFVAA